MPNDGFPPTRPDGTNHGHSRNSATTPGRVRTAENMVKAAQLRAAGATFREIGEALDIDHTWARTLVLKALEAAHYEAADMMRIQEGQRLDRLQRAHWPAALNGHLGSTQIILRVMERRARLFGLDSPVKADVEVTWTPEQVDDEMETLLAALARNDEPPTP